MLFCKNKNLYEKTMASLNRLINGQRRANKTYRRLKMRNHLYAKLGEDFAKVPDHRVAHTQISLCDALMSGLAMFCLKEPSL